jgi:hypothetical protein
MILAALMALFAACDLGEHFAKPENWKTTAVDFTVDRAADGFKFASQKRDAAVCMKKGACTWYGLDVWEARVYFAPTGVEKVELSLYNRGDDSAGVGLDAARFQELLASLRAKLGAQARQGRLRKTELQNGGYQYKLAWSRINPAVELTWGTTGGNTRTRRVDFVRLTAQPAAAARPKGAVKSVSGNVARVKVKSNVTKNAEGDVWIKNIPMVDQGQKGYCSAAVAERVLRYYGHDIDEHEIAQMAGTEAKKGTSVREMINTVRTIGSKCRLGFCEVVAMGGTLAGLEDEIERYNKAAKALKEPAISLVAFTEGNLINVSDLRRAMKPKVLKRMREKDSRLKKFKTAVVKQIDQGIPLIWGVTLGYFPEPEIPQAFGGHMRLIIGYNLKTQEILYSDTWGVGHELKRMPTDWAFTITHDAFFLKPL